MIAQSLMMLSVCLYYRYNKDVVTAKYCINKNKPALHCNGKCFLFKKLKQAEEKGRGSDENVSSFFFYVFLQPGSSASTIKFSPRKREVILRDQPLRYFIYSKDFFHPPLV